MRDHNRSVGQRPKRPHEWESAKWLFSLLQSRKTTTSAVLVLLMSVACDDAPTAPETSSCDVAELVLSVEADSGVVFDWVPACPVAVLFLETENAGDPWVIAAPGALDGDDLSVSWNIIAPPVTYGVTPFGVDDQDDPADPLLPGVRYQLIVWRVLESGLVANMEEFTMN